ncbi:MAG TPA: hypothetical protein VJ999_06295 [Candidatus Sulfotelmatobacter sp.]|nr:hypothetical protein [Candidatus Sulfotelmatobacter sp.]
MRQLATVSLAALAVMALWVASVSGHPREPAQLSVAVYDSNPSHLWNRLYAALLMREDRHGHYYGEDSLDPLLWLETEHLLAGPSHDRALRVLDEFLKTHGENLIHDPLKRAMLQRDLWVVFDWSVQQFSRSKRPSYAEEKLELQARLAEVLRRLELSPKEIERLPDNYAQALASGTFAREYDPAHPDRTFLPPDLFDPRGPWVGISPSPESDSGVAKMHIFNFSGRSGFLVFVRLPEGRKATFDYFQSLWNFPQPYVQGPISAADQAPVNPDLPSFPAGTQVALVRRMTLIDNEGNLVASSLTESVQIRVYHKITATEERNFSGTVADIVRNTGQDFYEIKLSRPLLFSGKNGGLRAIGRDEKEFSTFQTKGDDPIEEPGDPKFESNAIPKLQTCAWCHSGGGVRSLNSREALLKPNRRQQEPANADYGPIYWGDSAAIEWKQSHYDWGLLNGYWRAAHPQ